MRKIFSFLLSLLIIGGIAFLVWQQPMFFQRQFDKLRGVYYVYKGDIEYKQLHLKKAIDYYRRAVSLYPGHYGAWYNLGNIYVVFEDYYSAVDAYEQAFTHNPKMIVARMNYGIVSAEKLGDFDGAIDQYNEILKTKRHLLAIPFVYSNRKSYKVNRGLAYYNRGIAYKQKSIYIDNNYSDRYQYLSKALESYKEASKILKNDYDARYNLALTYHLLGDYRNAGLSYCKAIELAPMKYESHYNLAILLRRLKFYKESLEELEKATTLIANSDSGLSSQQMYIFDVMNDVTRTILANSENQFVEKITNEPSEKNKVTYVGGRLVFSDELDKALLKNFKVCGAKKIIQNEIDDEDIRMDVNVPGG